MLCVARSWARMCSVCLPCSSLVLPHVVVGCPSLLLVLWSADGWAWPPARTDIVVVLVGRFLHCCYCFLWLWLIIHHTLYIIMYTLNMYMLQFLQFLHFYTCAFFFTFYVVLRHTSHLKYYTSCIIHQTVYIIHVHIIQMYRIQNFICKLTHMDTFF